MFRIRLASLLGMAIVMGVSAGAQAATVLYAGRTVTDVETLSDPTDLWVSTADLTRINGFELKPEGACLEEICIPVKPGDSTMVVERDGASWFNVSELARKLGQAYVHESEVWSFSEVPALQQNYYQSAIAPDFELQDREGNTIRLSDFRGKKVLLITWASW